MVVTVVVGMAYGDEGKGRAVDNLSEKADAVVRFQGGANAGHTLYVNGEKTVLHLIPCGALYPEVDCYLARGMVIDPKTFLTEIEELKEKGVSMEGRLFISDKAPLIMPWHIKLDEAREKGDGSIGTTKRGIGPCYEQFVARQAIVASDLRDPELAIKKIETFYSERAAMLFSHFDWDYDNDSKFSYVQDVVEQFRKDYETTYSKLVPYICDVESTLRRRVREGHNIVLEGAQGTFLDVGIGSYPYVTSSHTTSAGACTGSGLAPRAIDHVVGVSKAYVTRVGDGPFHTELDVDHPVAQHLQKVGKEFGATTGRPRRCGWLDIDQLCEAAEINGCDQIVLTKLDVLSGLATIKVKIANEYAEFEGWDEDISGVRSLENLPEQAQKYVKWIDSQVQKVGSRISSVSVGPNRDEIFSFPSS